MKRFLIWTMALAVILLSSLPLPAANLIMLMPSNRTAFQTNEIIELAVVRSDTQVLPTGILSLTVAGDDSSKMNFTFPVKSIPVIGPDARSTEKFVLNGWLMRPGGYTITIACDGATVQQKIEVFSHIRKSTYRTIHWGGIKDKDMITEGENGMGFNLALGGTGEPSIRGGLDVMDNCLMGGGHQFWLKLTNDWSDPNVYIGSIQYGINRAFSFRSMPNAIGAHLFDEPGLTWLPHPYIKDKAGIPYFSPHDIPQQRAEYERVYNEEMPWFDKVDTSTPEGLEKWNKISEFKLGLMDAVWKTAQNAFGRLKPEYISVTQSQYGWYCFHDGYYFNVARSLPVISGHGGYSNYLLMNFNPSYFLELGLPRQLDKPTWYLPEWNSMSSDSFRGEHNLSFITGIQGMSTPPGMNVNSTSAAGITESNKLFSRLGTIFEKPKITRQDVAVLYSKSCIVHSHGGSKQAETSLPPMYTALKLIQYPMSIVLDEDILDGTLAANHKAIILTGLDYLDPAIIASLEDFVKNGGVVYITADCTINVAGAVILDVIPNAIGIKKQEELKKITDPGLLKTETSKANSFTSQLEIAAPVAKVLKAALLAKGIAPAFDSDITTLAAGKQIRGEIEYIFAVNFTPEPGYGLNTGGYCVPIAAKANISLPNDGRPIYNAITGGQTTFTKNGQKMTASLHFGPGQMLAFARTMRPIGSVTVGAPVINRDLTRDKNLQNIDFNATLLDTQNNILAGTAPLQIKVVDPLGVVRYDIFRSTDNGVCLVSLPIAANDAAGNWTVSVKELLANTTDTATFTLNPSRQCGVIAGASNGASYFWGDKENFFQFFRNHRNINIVVGTSEYNNAAADRMIKIFKPYNITATILPINEANSARSLTDEEAKTWCGLIAKGSLDIPTAMPQRNNPKVVGYNLQNPTILLGNAQDNPLIKYLNECKVLPYTQTADFPGRGHGVIAWNIMTLGHDVESIALIANDVDGINEAISTLFCLGVGIDPLTPFTLPTSNVVSPATQPAIKQSEAPILWQIQLPDRIHSMTATADEEINANQRADVANTIIAYSANGFKATIDAKGKAIVIEDDNLLTINKPVTIVPDTLKASLIPGATVKMVTAANNMIAIAYWGGTVQTFGTDGVLITQQALPQDITAMVWMGNILVAGLADGCILGLKIK